MDNATTRLEKSLELLLREIYGSLLSRSVRETSYTVCLTDPKGHGYSVYTDLVYKAVFGMNSKQLREKFGIDKKIIFVIIFLLKI